MYCVETKKFCFDAIQQIDRQTDVELSSVAELSGSANIDNLERP